MFGEENSREKKMKKGVETPLGLTARVGTFEFLQFLALVEFEISLTKPSEPEVGGVFAIFPSILKGLARLAIEVGDVFFLFWITWVGERKVKLCVGFVGLMKVDVADGCVGLGIIGLKKDALGKGAEGIFIVGEKGLLLASHVPIVSFFRLQFGHAEGFLQSLVVLAVVVIVACEGDEEILGGGIGEETVLEQSEGFDGVAEGGCRLGTHFEQLGFEVLILQRLREMGHHTLVVVHAVGSEGGKDGDVGEVVGVGKEGIALAVDEERGSLSVEIEMEEGVGLGIVLLAVVVFACTDKVLAVGKKRLSQSGTQLRRGFLALGTSHIEGGLLERVSMEPCEGEPMDVGEIGGGVGFCVQVDFSVLYAYLLVECIDLVLSQLRVVGCRFVLKGSIVEELPCRHVVLFFHGGAVFLEKGGTLVGLLGGNGG